VITSNKELQATLERIAWMHGQLVQLRRVETNPKNYHASASGFISEIDRMQLEVREFLLTHPAEAGAA
jgi:hypothetical protein